MSTAFIIILGSRGDTEPQIALSHQMLNSGKFAHIHIALQPDVVPLVPKDPRLHVHPLPLSSADYFSIFRWAYLKHRLFSFFTGNFDLIRLQVSCFATFIARHFVPALPMLLDVANNAKPAVVLATTLAGPVATTIAECLDIPMVLFNYQPNTPTDRFPYYMSSMSNALLAAEKIRSIRESGQISHDPAFFESYGAQDRLHDQSLSGLNSFRMSHNLEPLQSEDIKKLHCAQRRNMHVINSYNTQLVPVTTGWAARVHVVPPLADDYIPSDWTAEKYCPTLQKYLDDSADKPFLVTFGSMSVLNKTNASCELLRGLRAAGLERVVLQKGAAELGAHHLAHGDEDLKQWAEEHVFMSSEKVQFAWLLLRVAGMLCHGGAGTTFASLRAGQAVAVAPVLCDQFMWGRLVEDLGVGAVVEGGLSEMEGAAVERAVRLVLEDGVRERAREFGERERKENGCERAARIVEEITGV